MNRPFDKRLAARMFGSQAAIARALGVTRAAVNSWPDPIPEPRASQIREAARRFGLMRGDRIIRTLQDMQVVDLPS